MNKQLQKITEKFKKAVEEEKQKLNIEFAKFNDKEKLYEIMDSKELIVVLKELIKKIKKDKEIKNKEIDKSFKEENNKNDKVFDEIDDVQVGEDYEQ